MPAKTAKDKLEDFLTTAPGQAGLDLEMKKEFIFHPTRKWRFDFAWPEIKTAVEFDGVMKRTVGHNSLGGILRDSEKINEAQRHGWRVFRANAKSVGDKTFFALIQDVLREEAIITP